MPRTLRLALFLFSMAGLAVATGFVIGAMPTFGSHPLPYGDLINRLAPVQRHVTNMVTAVNFDYRAFDTLGEELMLFTAVTGVAVLLRGGRGEDTTALPAMASDRDIPPRSDAVTLAGRLFGPWVIVFGFYVVLHAQLTPGGGFQGGVIIASGLLLLYLGEGYKSWRRIMRNGAFDAMEGGGAALYAVAGFIPMVMGANYLANTLALGETKALLSGGLILILNWAVALAVIGAFAILFIEFLEETRAEEDENS